LIDAVRWAFARPELDAARAVAERVLHRSRGDDDAAAMALRLSRSFHGIVRSDIERPQCSPSPR
jgi:hypothetical protein